MVTHAPRRNHCRVFTSSRMQAPRRKAPITRNTHDIFSSLRPSVRPSVRLLGFWKRYTKSAATRKAAEAQGLKLARQLAVVREKARIDRESLEVKI